MLRKNKCLNIPKRSKLVQRNCRSTHSNPWISRKSKLVQRNCRSIHRQSFNVFKWRFPELLSIMKVPVVLVVSVMLKMMVRIAIMDMWPVKLMLPTMRSLKTSLHWVIKIGISLRKVRTLFLTMTAKQRWKQSRLWRRVLRRSRKQLHHRLRRTILPRSRCSRLQLQDLAPPTRMGRDLKQSRLRRTVFRRSMCPRMYHRLRRTILPRSMCSRLQQQDLGPPTRRGRDLKQSRLRRTVFRRSMCPRMQLQELGPSRQRKQLQLPTRKNLNFRPAFARS